VHSAPSTLRISVITVVRNGAAAIKRCLESVAHQTLAAEHIVVDGNSTDGTLDLLLKAQARNPRLRVISESDGGIYDAMNKGVRLARGEVIGCLNADDFYARSHVLERVLGAFADAGLETCYGDLVYVRADSENSRNWRATERGALAGSADGESRLTGDRVVRRWRAGAMPDRAFYWGWMPPHPTFFVRRTVYEQYGLFRLDLGTAADYELMLRFLVKHRVTTRYLPEVLVKMGMGGVSNATWRNRLRANRNDRRAWEVNGLKPYPWTLWLKPLRKLGQFVVKSEG
jgi:glycosyltransferase involved in cell wall biosynthesis